ncbi:MAG: outer membrane beta-barrel protein [Tannerella sp.]|jgi:hypothetical protein|nr:outer membrane beta-barrel protein [Tannerella sp.]
MALRRFLGFLFWLLPAISLTAQIEVRGTIIESGSKEPIEQATVRLLSNKDSSLVTGDVSGRDGSFAVKKVKAGDYILEASFIGFEPEFISLKITGRTNPVNVGQIEMHEESVLLGEAVITAKAVEVTVKGDTVEYNADSYKLAEGSMLEDLLKKMPGVEVSNDGTVTVNGKEIKKVLVDGKEFFSDDPKVASKNLPAKMVEKVQAYDKRSDMAMMTGFNDGDEEAVINLTVRPGMKRGWFGNAFAGYGSQERYEGNFMVNKFVNNDQLSAIGGINNTNNMGFTDLASSMFSGMGGGGRRMMMNFGGNNGITQSGNIGTNFSKEFSSKLTIGGNARYSHSDNEADSKNVTENILKSGNTSDYDKSHTNTLNDNLGINLRLTWKPDTLTQLIFTPNFSYSRTNQSDIGDSYTLNSSRDSMNTVTSNSGSKGSGYNTSARLEASRKLNSSGRTLSISLSGGTGDTKNDGTNYSLTRYFQEAMPADLVDQQTNYHNTSYNYRGFVSFVEPLGYNNFLQLTYSYSGSRNEAIKNAYTGANYTELDSAYSKSSRNESANQRASVAFKSQRDKYNYTVGFNVDPSWQKTGTFVGNTILYSNSRNVVNYSPSFQFIYRPAQQTDVRIDYEGRTSQPSMLQLQPVEDVSNPLNTTIGNPELKPLYTNSLRMRFQKFIPEQQTALLFFGSANYIINDIVNSTVNDPTTGKKYTTYENVNGNYNFDGRFIFNTPLKNKKFSINSMLFGRYANANSLIDEAKNMNKSLQLQERLTLNYRSDLFDFGLNGNISYRNTSNSLETGSNLKTYDYGGGMNTSLYLPYDFRVESDINYSTNSGYSDGYEQNELLWNASLSKSFLAGNAATLRLKIYDILQQRSSISYSTTSTYTRYSEYNTLNSYFMLHFIYKFSVFAGGGKESDMRRGGPFGGGPPPGGGGPGRF